MPRGKYLAICFAAFIGVATSTNAQNPGRYTGEAVLTMLPDGRNMQLKKAFGYIDQRGTKWNVPAGAKTDGASIPRVLWVTYPPFTGKYRLAAVIHDYYCQQRSRGWRDTHKVFYEAMRTSGVPEQTAKVMYGAVYGFGPRWGTRSDQSSPGPRAYPTDTKQTEFMRDLEAWVARDNPSPDDIEKALDAGRISKKTD